MIRAVWWTLCHFVRCPLCRPYPMQLLRDLRWSELRYVKETFFK